MEKYSIEKIHDYTATAKIIFEHDLQFNGYSYLVIFGSHINGGFINIPNWNIGTKASKEGSIIYNAEQLTKAGLDEPTAWTIAQHISDTLNSMNESEGE